MDCTHDTPGGSTQCAFCRRSILDLHGPRPARAYYVRSRADVPMPPDFRERVAAARERSRIVVQEELDLS